MRLDFLRRIEPVYRMLVPVRAAAGRLWMRAAHRLRGVKPGTVFFSSFHGRTYSDSPRAICEALHALRPDLDIVWQLSEPPEDLPGWIRVVRPHTVRALSEISTARCIVDNFNRPVYMLKFGGQMYVQTWHGDRGFKKILLDLNDGVDYPDGRQMDLAVSGSDFGTRVFRSAFGYEGEVLEAGMPRNDLLLNPDPDRAARTRAALGVPDGARVLLYAPTFRDATAGRKQPAGFDLARALAALARGSGDAWVCLARAHDLNAGIGGAGIPGVTDVTAWPEMNRLLEIADVLVTDYSSSAGDFILTGRPVILYQPDRAAFIADERRMYFDLDACPHLKAEGEEELMDMLSRLDRLPDVSGKVAAFYGVKETGAAAQAAAQWISRRIPRTR